MKWFAAMVLVSVAGCGSREAAPVRGDAPGMSSGGLGDGGHGDGGSSDGPMGAGDATSDGGSAGAGMVDASVFDAGPVVDGGWVSDAGTVDARRVVDAGNVDARAVVDAGREAQTGVDAGSVDARTVTDAGVVDARTAVVDAPRGPRDAVAPPVDAPMAKADIQDVGAPGEAVTLVPVAGKVTVFDFHASWCTPCKEVDRELTALAKAYPDRVAIRRIDVEDMDTPGAEKYLVPGGFALPHVKVYSAAKQQVLEQSASNGGVAGLVAKVRALVEGS